MFKIGDQVITKRSVLEAKNTGLPLSEPLLGVVTDVQYYGKRVEVRSATGLVILTHADELEIFNGNSNE